MAHAKIFGASKAYEWGNCPGSVALSKDIPDQSSSFAREGTAAHTLAELVLTEKIAKAEKVLGKTITVEGQAITVDDEMVASITTYVNDVIDATPVNAIRLIEERVDYSHPIAQTGAFGTADVIVISGDEIQVHDLKYGKGVQVDAKENWQLMLYALGAYELYGIAGDFKSIRLFIHQPRLHHLSEWVLSVEDLLAFGEDMKARAARVFSSPDEMNPGEKQCRWCKAKATCPALQKQVMDEFDKLTKPEDGNVENEVLGRAMSHVDMIESWCKAVRAETERRLLTGHEIPGFKLVEGRRGARKWADASLVEDALKAMRVKASDMYEQKLISPTKAEKLVKSGVIGKRQWDKLIPQMVQAEGKPSVAKSSDARPAKQYGLEFQNVS